MLIVIKIQQNDLNSLSNLNKCSENLFGICVYFVSFYM